MEPILRNDILLREDYQWVGLLKCLRKRLFFI